MGHDHSKSSSPQSKLSNPIDIIHCSSTVQGRRPYNEDRYEVRHPLVLSPSPSPEDSKDENPHGQRESSSSRSTSTSTTKKDKKSKSPEPPPSPSPSLGCSFFAVYDGHGGEAVAEWCTKHLHSYIYQQPTFKSKDKDKAIYSGFFACDAACLAEQLKTDNPLEGSGTTVSCLLIDHEVIYAGNCGDTRTILCRNGQCVELSRDHKPTDEEEKKRVEAGGGKVNVSEHKIVNKKTGKTTVIQQAYVELHDKGLAVSRALGNPAFKQNKSRKDEDQIIVCTPFIHKEPRQADVDEFIIVASDGLWTIISNQAACDWVRRELSQMEISPSLTPEQQAEEQREAAQEVCHRLTQYALDKKSNDNITVVLIVFPAARTLRERTSSSLADDNGNSFSMKSSVSVAVPSTLGFPRQNSPPTGSKKQTTSIREGDEEKDKEK